jgi:hypothetical protein
MKANELRIGNYIKLMFNYEDYELLQVTSDELVDVDKKRADYEPIPLTEEWLYKFGFKDIDKGDHDYNTYTDSNHNYYLQIDVRKKDGKYSILDNSFDDLRDFSMVDISYVHQLQNLYFALTGEELIYYLNMNKEQIIEAVGQEYTKWFYDNAVPSVSGKPILNGEGILTRGEFINKCKTNSEFSKTWGLKIEERELSLEERGELFRKTYPGKSVDDFAPSGMEVQSIRHQLDARYNKANIPTKLITITYKNERIESYE